MNRLLVGLVFAVITVGCSANLPPGTTTENPIVPGQQDFVSLERDYSGSYSDDRTAAGAPGGGSENAGQAGPPSNAKAPSGREGTVEEADIYRVDANRLFYLNTYRGFIIYDLNDPKNPKQVSRLPVHGYPIEMFVTPTTVYALLRDALYVTQDIQGLSFKRHNVSQLVAIDIQDLKNPKVIKTIDIVGELKEGVSRKIDDTVYLVSHLPQSYYWAGYPYGAERTEQAWVYSFNVADPKNPVLMQKLKVFEGGGGYSNTGTSSTSKYFSGVTISATANTLHVVENWHTYGWVSGSSYNCGASRSMQEAVVSIIDISDPTGKIRLHSRFSTYGALNDQFKQTYVHNPTTGKGYYLGIFQRQEWSSINCSGTSFIQNNIESWDITDGANPVRVSSLSFGKPNETVRGSTFDTKRSVAFAITARQIDPLYAISFADPAKLSILSQIDGLSGDMNVFRLVGDGKFLLGIGRDNDVTCSGYGTAATGWSANVAVSVIDVQNLSAIRLVQRKCVTVNNASWVWSDLNWNLDQAHKMLGMHSDARASVISVPVSYYTKTGSENWWWWYRPESAVGLMSFDLAAYDPAKDHLNQKVLNNHGTVVHSSGHVVRSIVFTHVGATERRMMVNLSQTHVSVTDIDNLDLPVAQSVIEVAPYHQRLHRFGDYVVDEVRQGSEYSYQPGASEFRVKRAAKGLDEGQVVASFTVPRVQQVMQFKNLLVLFRQANDASTPYYQRKTHALIYDLTVPTAPVKVSEAELPTQVMPYVWYGCGGWGYYPSYYSGSWAASELGLGLLSWTYANNTSTQQLIFLDLTAPATPKVVTRTLASQTYDYRYGYAATGRQYMNLIGDGTRLIANYKEKVGSFDMGDGTRFAQMRYYAEVFPTTDLVPATPINIPGRLIQATDRSGDRTLLTTDEVFKLASHETNSAWIPQARLHLVKLSATKSTLLDTMSLGGLQVGDMVGDSSRLFMTLRQGYSYWYGYDARGGGSSSAPSDSLTILDLSQGRLTKKFSAPVGTYSAQLMGVSGDRLFVNLPGDGVLAVDVSNLSAPVGQHFLRTLGYATHIVFAADTAFIAAGNFGIYEMDLASKPTILHF